MVVAAAALWLAVAIGTAWADIDWHGVVIHEMPDLYLADNVTMRPDAGKEPLRILVPRPQVGALLNFMVQTAVPSLKLVVKHINEHPTLLPNHVLELHLVESGCADNSAILYTLQALIGNPAGYFKAVNGPVCSDPVGVINDALQAYNLFQISSVSRSPLLASETRYPNLCRTTPHLGFPAEATVRLMEIFGWRRAALVDDGRGLSDATANYILYYMGQAAEMFGAAGGDPAKCTGHCFPFDMGIMMKHKYALTGDLLMNLGDVVSLVKEAMKAGHLRLLIFSGYEDYGYQLFCQMYHQGFADFKYAVLLPTGWWASRATVFFYRAVPNYHEVVGCQLPELESALHGLIAVDTLSWPDIPGKRHDVTGALLSDIKAEAHTVCITTTEKGCNFEIAAYEYDTMVAMAAMFHKWMYEHGNALSQITSDNATATSELYETMLGLKFWGTSGQLEFFDVPGMNCERKGQFVLKQWIAKDDGGFFEIRSSFSTSEGFATIEGYAWTPIVWRDNTTTMFGSGQGFVAVQGGVPASFGSDTMGLENVPVDSVDPVSCPAGSEPDASLIACTLCPKGSFGEGNACKSCTAGYFADEEGMTTCKACDAGSFAASEGSVNCQLCQAGRSTEGARGSPTCTDCPKGKYSEEGDMDCTYCPRGTYGNSTASGSCFSCGSMTTIEIASESQAACVCTEGSYRMHGSSSCSPCPPGMRCPIGADTANFALAEIADGASGSIAAPYPVVLPRHWSSQEDPTSVFVCRSDMHCPGGAPESCGHGLLGRACETCEDGFHFDGTGCSACTSVETSQVLFPVLPVLILPIVILVMYWTGGSPVSTWNDWKKTCACVAFICLNHYQVVDLLRRGNILAPSTLTGTAKIWSFTNDMVSILKIDCAGFGGFQASFAVKAASPLILLLFFGITKVGSIAASKALNKPQLNMSTDRLINDFMCLMFTFFSAISALSLLLFKCVPSPNNMTTLSEDLSVICWDSPAWQSLIGISATCVLLYCIAPGALFLTVIVQAPQKDRFTSRAFQTRWTFLFVKFRPTVWWWAMVFLLKNFAFNLGFVIFPDGVQQMYWAMAVIVSYMLAVVFFQPYRTRAANFVEMIACVSIVFFASFMTWFAAHTEEHDSALSATASVMTFMPLIISVLALALVVLQNTVWATQRHEGVEKTHALIVQSLGNYLAICQKSQNSGANFYQTVGDWDQWYMKKVAEMISAELSGDCGRSSGGLRLVDGSLSDLSKSMSDSGSQGATSPPQSIQVDVEV
jgi:hypothetical protein